LRQSDQCSQEGETNWRSALLSFSLARIKQNFSCQRPLVPCVPTWQE